MADSEDEDIQALIEANLAALGLPPLCPICGEKVTEPHRHEVRAASDIFKWQIVYGKAE